MSNGNINQDSLRAKAIVLAEQTLRAKRLEPYPLLVHAPLQESHGHGNFGKTDLVDHSPMLRTEDNGTSVANICRQAAAVPNGDIDTLAEQFFTTPEHVRQALAYEAEHGLDDA